MNSGLFDNIQIDDTDNPVNDAMHDIIHQIEHYCPACLDDCLDMPADFKSNNRKGLSIEDTPTGKVMATHITSEAWFLVTISDWYGPLQMIGPDFKLIAYNMAIPNYDDDVVQMINLPANSTHAGRCAKLIAFMIKNCHIKNLYGSLCPCGASLISFNSSRKISRDILIYPESGLFQMQEALRFLIELKEEFLKIHQGDLIHSFHIINPCDAELSTIDQVILDIMGLLDYYSRNNTMLKFFSDDIGFNFNEYSL